MSKVIICYNSMDQIMSDVFKAKVRKVGNSLGIIIPSGILDEIEVSPGDEVNVSISNDDLKERNRKLRELCGVYKGKGPFIREKEDRF